MRSILARLAVAAAAMMPLASIPAYVYNTITYPGAVTTDVRGINATGQLVGYASLDGVSFFAFTYQSGSFTPLPPAPFPLIGHGINDAGVVVGTANFTPQEALPALVPCIVTFLVIANGYLFLRAKTALTAGAA